MSDRTIETTEIGRGVKYAKVSERLKAFHTDNPEGSIETACQFNDGWVIFSAVVKTKRGSFHGHSMAKVGGREKQFEKQETIAVGRALAFAGYLADGAIACAEELSDVVTAVQLNSLKHKFAQANRDEFTQLDQAEKAQQFQLWCREIIGEDVDYSDRGYWQPEWLQECLNALNTDGVPFE